MPLPDEALVHVPAQLAAESERVLQRLGLSVDEAVRLFLSQVALRRGLPFAVTLPPEEPEREDSDILLSAATRQTLLDSFYDDAETR